MIKIFISTFPFGEFNTLPIDLLNSKNVEYLVNPYGRKLTKEELALHIADIDILIAGTELIDSLVLDCAKKLRLISRVGIGLDNVDLVECKKRKIQVCYTPDAPTEAVAELTIGLMFSLLRHIHEANHEMHNARWKRFFGSRLSDLTIGIIGVGRIGSRVYRHLKSFGVKNILLNDINPEIKNQYKCVNFDEIIQTSDLISLHVPLTEKTVNLIGIDQLLNMKKSAFLINTSRGGVINENDLFNALTTGLISGAAVDVFQKEPYLNGPLAQTKNCLLTSHMGSMTYDCRARMEIEATENALAFLDNKNISNMVSEEDYF
jgi:D-3-phosphoglycerate dehydrogenase